MNKPANEPQPLPPDHPAGEEPSLEEFRHMLMRRLRNLRESWRACPAPVCRRAHACAHPEFQCVSEATPPSDPEKTARVLALLRKRLERLALSHVDEAEDQDAVQRR